VFAWTCLGVGGVIRRAMLDRIRSLARGARGGGKGGRQGHDELHLAVAVLLVEAARMDSSFDAEERATIRRLVQARLGLDDTAAEALIVAADEVAEESGELWTFARVVKDRFSYDERVEMLEMMWEVAYADGTLHHYEANLLRRVAGLIYVSDRDSGVARKRAMERLGITDEPAAP